jgi:hypothetical protein
MYAQRETAVYRASWRVEFFRVMTPKDFFNTHKRKHGQFLVDAVPATSDSGYSAGDRRRQELRASIH